MPGLRLLLAWCAVHVAAAQEFTVNDTARLEGWCQALASEVSNLLKSNGGFTATQAWVNGLVWDRTDRNASAILEETQRSVGLVLETVEAVVFDLRKQTERMARHGEFDTVYWDSERVYGQMPGGLYSAVPNANRTVDTRFAWDVDFDYTSVRVPDALSRDDTSPGGLVEFIRWSSRLTGPVRVNRFKSPLLLYQYVASQAGSVRVYPGLDWPRNHLGTPQSFRTEARPWFSGAALYQPRDVVVVLDTSASMALEGRYGTALRILEELFVGLGQDDHIAVVATGQTSKDRYELSRTKEPAEIVGCGKTTLHPATDRYRRTVMRLLEGSQPYGGTEMATGLLRAFALLSASRAEPRRAACQQAVVVITDNEAQDPGAHCGSGSYDETGQWNAPPLCDYSSQGTQTDVTYSNVFQRFEDVVRAHSPGGAAEFGGPIFSFAVGSGGDGFTGRACPRGRSGVHRHVPAAASVRQVKAATREYRSWATSVRSETNSDRVHWTEPFVDAGGTGRLILTASLVYNVNREYAGVVGVDVSLSDVELLIQSKLWGDAYAFVLNRRGDAVIHPRNVHPRHAVDGITFPAVEDLEMYEDRNGVMQPTGFLSVKASMLAGNTSSALLSSAIFWKRGSRRDGFDVVEGQLLNYTWGPLTSANASLFICFVSRSGIDDQTYTPTTNTTGAYFDPSSPVVQRNTQVPPRSLGRPVGVYNRLDVLPQSSLTLHGLNASTDVRLHNFTAYPGGPVYTIREAWDRQTFQVPASCFCSPDDYESAGRLGEEGAASIDRQVSFAGAPNSCSAVTSGDKYTLSPECVSDIRMWQAGTSDFHVLDIASSQPIFASELQGGIVRRYVGSRTGAIVQFPGPMQPKLRDARTEPWYALAVSAPRSFAVGPIKHDASAPKGESRLITVGRAVMQGYNQLLNSTCTNDHDCNAAQATAVEQRAVCWNGVCSSRTVAGVQALDLKVSSWAAMVARVVGTTVAASSNTTQVRPKRCGATYTCNVDGVGNTTTCETRCYVLSSGGYVLYNSSSSWPEVNRSISLHLGEVEGELMRQLTYNKSVYTRVDHYDTQGLCGLSSSWQLGVTDQVRDDTDWDGTLGADDLTKGPRPPASRRTTARSCPVTRTFYRVNTATFQATGQSTVTGTLAGCQKGEYAASLVVNTASSLHTDMVLVEIRNYFDTSAARHQHHGATLPPIRDFSCVITSAATRAGSVYAPLPECRNFTSAQSAAGVAAYAPQETCLAPPQGTVPVFTCGCTGLRPLVALAAVLAVLLL